MSTQHIIDTKPVPDGTELLVVNEPWLADFSSAWMPSWKGGPEGVADNVRIYVPLDLNARAILRRLKHVISIYGEANEENEMSFSLDAERLVDQIEIYDQVWLKRHPGQEPGTDGKRHSEEAKGLVRRFIAELEAIPDGCAECFPFDMIEELKQEYLQPEEKGHRSSD